eukprot:354621-Chlamydomonas_euryale.AAC.2
MSLFENVACYDAAVLAPIVHTPCVSTPGARPHPMHFHTPWASSTRACQHPVRVHTRCTSTPHAYPHACTLLPLGNAHLSSVHRGRVALVGRAECVDGPVELLVGQCGEARAAHHQPRVGLEADLHIKHGGVGAEKLVATGRVAAIASVPASATCTAAEEKRYQCQYHAHGAEAWMRLCLANAPLGPSSCQRCPIPSYTVLYHPIPSYTVLYRPIPSYTVL